MLEKHNKLRLFLIHCFTFSQIFLIGITMLLMAIFWIAPMKLDLTKDLPNWRDEIRNYDYRLPSSTIRRSSPTAQAVSTMDNSDVHGNRQLDYLSDSDLSENQSRRNGDSPASHLKYAVEIQSFSSQLDSLQQTLGCCGVHGRSDWVVFNSEWSLFAPSCCRNPAAFLTNKLRRPNGTYSETPSASRGPEEDGGPAESSGGTRKIVSKVEVDGLMNGLEKIGRSPSGGSVHGGADDGQEIIYHCPMDDDEPESLRSSGDVVINTNNGRKLSAAPSSQTHLRPNELLELQLAIEWTGSPRSSGNFQLNQQQQLELSLVYGCQRTIDERDSRCLFGLRLRLLILVSFLFLNVIARSAALEHQRPRDQFNRIVRARAVISAI